MIGKEQSTRWTYFFAKQRAKDHRLNFRLASAILFLSFGEAFYSANTATAHCPARSCAVHLAEPSGSTQAVELDFKKAIAARTLPIPPMPKPTTKGCCCYPKILVKKERRPPTPEEAKSQLENMGADAQVILSLKELEKKASPSSSDNNQEDTKKDDTHSGSQKSEEKPADTAPNSKKPEEKPEAKPDNKNSKDNEDDEDDEEGDDEDDDN